MDNFNNFRARRTEAYRAAEILETVIDNLGVDDGKYPPIPDIPVPTAPSEAHKAEMKNALAVLLRTILIWNDGNVSVHELRRW